MVIAGQPSGLVAIGILAFASRRDPCCSWCHAYGRGPGGCRGSGVEIAVWPQLREVDGLGVWCKPHLEVEGPALNVDLVTWVATSQRLGGAMILVEPLKDPELIVCAAAA